MPIVSILIALVIFGIGMAILYKILLKIMPMLGLDADWINIIFGIIGLIMLIFLLGMLGYGPSWIVLR